MPRYRRSSLMRVDPSFEDLVKVLRKELEDISKKELSNAEITRFIKDTYPSGMITLNIKKRLIKEKNEDIIDWLGF